METNGHQSVTERVLCIRELRWSGRNLEQKLLIHRTHLDGTQQDVEEWSEVPRPGFSDTQFTQRLPSQPDNFWTGLDWDKTNILLSKETGYSPQYVRLKRMMFGRKRLPFAMQLGIDWSKSDWTKSDCELARENRVAIGSVRKARHFLNQPVYDHTRQNRVLKVSEEAIEQTDWLNRNDSELAKEWGVSREYVRQIRLTSNKPVCRFKNVEKLSQKHREAYQWLLDNRTSIEGKHQHDVARMIPSDIKISTRIMLMKRSGITFDCNRKWKHRVEKPWNFDLPNKWLERIWGLGINYAASCRSQLMKSKSLWYSGGFGRKYLSDPEFREAVKAEIQKAKAAGVAVDEAGIWNEI